MIIFIRFLKKFFLEKIKIIYSLSIIAKSNSTCDFHYSTKIFNSSFGEYVKIFENTKILNSRIDSFSYVQENSRIYNCEIGKFCSIASNVSLGPGIHDFGNLSTHPSFLQKSTPLPKVFSDNDYYITNKKIKIGNDVWIGQNVIVLDGIEIGNGSVIAAGSVITKNVKKYSIVGGIPAKLIKYRFDKKTIKNIESSRWWDNTLDWFEINFLKFKNVKSFNLNK